ncbi:MAG: hypothetical protein Q8Q81_19030 [Oxalobacteraceae bacterium]|nr:hypothetical protein [Oxalobacteraceae bacterium]
MNDNDELDATIPVLTEIIAQEQDFADAAFQSAPPEPPPPEDPGASETAELTEVAAEVAPSTALSESQWQALEHKISERVLRQLQTRIDFVLEHRIRDGLANALQLAVDGIAADIKRGLHQTLEDVIARAVAQEIAMLQTNGIKPDAHPAED